VLKDFFYVYDTQLVVVFIFIRDNMSITSVGPVKKTVRYRGKVIKRISDIEAFSTKNKLEFYPWDDFVKSYNSFKNPSPFEIGVVVSFGRLLPSSLISWFPRGCINAHPSLLPQWRGPAPIQHTLLSGQTTTGVSIQELSHNRFDAGRILMQTSCEVPPDVHFSGLSEKLADLSATLLAKTIDNIDSLRLLAREQDESRVTYAPKISSSVGNIDREQTAVDECLRLHRALGEHSGVWVRILEKRVRLLQLEDSRRTPGLSDDTAGVHYHHKDRVLYLKFSDGWIGVRRLQVETRNPVTATDLYNAYMAR
jgi:methionyl-tRNA formyltransferase